MSKFNIGDVISIGLLTTNVEGFRELDNVQMVSTQYGDFHPDLCKVVDKDIVLNSLKARKPGERISSNIISSIRKNREKHKPK